MSANYRHNLHGPKGRFIAKPRWIDPQEAAFANLYADIASGRIPILTEKVEPKFVLLPRRSWLERLIRWVVWNWTRP